MGMWQGLLQGYTQASERQEREGARTQAEKTRKEEKEEARQAFLSQQISKRKENLFNTIMPARAEAEASYGQMTSQAEYLVNRGLEKETVVALANDPAGLASAYEFARTKGADLDSETFNGIYRSAAGSVREGETVDDALRRASGLHNIATGIGGLSIDELAADEDKYWGALTAAQAPVSATGGTVEFRDPTKEKLSSSELALAKEQEVFFDRAVMTAVDADLARLEKEKKDGSNDEGLTKKISNLLTQVTDYDKSPAVKQELRSIYGDVAKTYLKNAPDIDAQYLAGIDNNPYISNIEGEYVPGTTSDTPAPATQIQSKEEYDALPAGTTYIDPNGVTRIKQ